MVGSNQAEALVIFSISLSHHVQTEPEWVPRKNNKIVDYLNCIVDYDDWSLSQSTFRELDAQWGPHIIDRFASYYNTQLPCFNSQFWNPSKGVDAFTCDWVGDSNWLCPPVYLILRVIQHARKCKVQGTLRIAIYPLLSHAIPKW